MEQQKIVFPVKTKTKSLNDDDDAQTSMLDKKRNHPYGVVWEGSECNILEPLPQGYLLIAPFHDHRYTYNVLVWDPRSLNILQKFAADRIWKLWDQYYVAFQKDMSYVDNLMIYMMTSKGLKKIKNVVLDMEYTFTNVLRILGSKLFKTIYVMEDYWVGAVEMNSSERSEWTSEEEILQAFLYEDLRLLAVCANSKIMMQKLDERGKIEDREECYSIPLKFRFAKAYQDKNDLVVISLEELEDKDRNILYISKYTLEDEEFKVVQEETELGIIPFTEYDFEFLPNNRFLICMSDHEPLTIISLETGETVYNAQIVGKFFKLNPKDKSLFVSNYAALQKFQLEMEALLE